MAVDTLCIHDLNPAWCATCLGLTKDDPDTIVAVASFVSRCTDCGDWILAGQVIRLVEGEWAHRDNCGSEEQ